MGRGRLRRPRIGVATASTLASPPQYTANTLVLLSQSGTDAAGNPIRNIDTETEIASSAEVLAIASRNLDPAPNVAELEAAVRVTETTPDILRFTAVAGSRSRAIAIANASADAYRDYKAVSATDLMEEVVSQLQRASRAAAATDHRRSGRTHAGDRRPRDNGSQQPGRGCPDEPHRLAAHPGKRGDDPADRRPERDHAGAARGRRQYSGYHCARARVSCIAGHYPHGSYSISSLVRSPASSLA